VYKEIADCWHKHNRNGHRDKLEPRSVFDKPYKMRGANRKLAIRENRPIELDRLALRAVSTMHLAHWRDDVTVASYMCKRKNDK
jgi:hypothetical protein